ncbi:nuclear transport factor 2 family protein [Micromonospora sp. 4G57]|uniref:Nuclear transport factor 2 family protein n=1 Tax=Micromonospora sicca TaxID=2202420 RepID=A0ABU5J6K6_9ACTN|nr:MULTISPECIES: nuclear transport factor 2 family protein [unclassified Micromonospora]MDZ5443065.1 nuclear transport factor 2 family protein [Micromonospora sp. 4G57]MDZ5488223.1 nuclear transport factor 2 family protein [Micromonospora sp. 4G53]
MTTTNTAPAIIRRYFQLASQADKEDFFALFTDDAVVEDESTEYCAIDAIRRWRSDVPLVSYEITDVEDTPTGTVVTATISGDFPGSPFAGLRFHFDDYDDTRIRKLRIAP